MNPNAYPIRQHLIPKPSKRRSGLVIAPGVKFLVAHDTGNPGSSAAANVRYYINSKDEKSASAHLFVDDREIVECIPAVSETPEKAWHVLYNVDTDDKRFGFNANDAAIGVEYCYGGGIDADEAYRRYVWLLALLCGKFGLDPQRQIAGHFELDPNRKTDPATGLAASHRSFGQLLRDVTAELGVGSPQTDLLAKKKKARAKTSVRVRSGAPNRLAPVARILNAGDPFEFDAVVEGESVLGNAHWLQSGKEFVWSGGVDPLP